MQACTNTNLSQICKAHTHRQPHIHTVKSEWQMKEVNCHGLTSSVAAGGYECTVISKEGKWICWLSLLVSEAISHLSFAPCFYSCHISPFCNIAPHLFVSWSLSDFLYFLLKKHVHWSTEKKVLLSRTKAGWLFHLLQNGQFRMDINHLTLIFKIHKKHGCCWFLNKNHASLPVYSPESMFWPFCVFLCTSLTNRYPRFSHLIY